MQTLRARLAVAEAKPVPYSARNWRCSGKRRRSRIPRTKRSIHELPSGTAELVVSAQRHFANQEFDAAEADYQQILEHDQNNGLVLANLATIELQEDKFDDAEKHITAALAQSPDDAYNLSTLGYLKFRQEKYDEALDALSRAAKLDPQQSGNSKLSRRDLEPQGTARAGGNRLAQGHPDRSAITRRRTTIWP